MDYGVDRVVAVAHNLLGLPAEVLTTPGNLLALEQAIQLLEGIQDSEWQSSALKRRDAQAAADDTAGLVVGVFVRVDLMTNIDHGDALQPSALDAVTAFLEQGDFVPVEALAGRGISVVSEYFACVELESPLSDDDDRPFAIAANL